MTLKQNSPAANSQPLPGKLPAHVAIIMDGNGRWAKARGLPRTLGHKKGAEALKMLLEECQRIGLRYVTLYAFSSENWKRPTLEVTDLMELLRLYLRHEIKQLHKDGVRLRIIGDTSKLADDIRRDIEQAEALTVNNNAFYLNVALSYGSRQEILRAVRKLAQDAVDGQIAPGDIDEAMLTARLDTHEIPDPDLLIRTGGEHRLSNFLLWQSAYTELFFTPVLWPDFGTEQLKEALDEYARRDRRFGNTE